MPRKKRRSFTQAFKLTAVERMASTESIQGLAIELGVERKLLYCWRDQFDSGGSTALRRVGRPVRPGPTGLEEAPSLRTDLTDAAAAQGRIDELERKACPWA